MEGLNEIKQVVILAAGRSRRMEDLSNNEPKCLLPYKGERVIERLVRQLKQNNIHDIVITTGYRADLMSKLFIDDQDICLVENELYEEDVNIYSLYLAMNKINGPCVIFEADTILEDDLVKYVVGSDFEGKSVWFTRGKFMESQYGGILHSDEMGNIDDIKIVAAYHSTYKDYMKLTGVMRVGANELDLFKTLLGKYAKTTLKQYFLNAWIENLPMLPCIEADISMFDFFTFNKPEEYYQIQGKEIGYKCEAPNIELIPVNSLKHIEAFDEERVKKLQCEIEDCGIWKRPLIVEKNSNLVLDGQHRLEVAKHMNLEKVPALLVNYQDVKLWSLRKEIPVSAEIVRKKVLQDGDIFPYKTVKHKFQFLVQDDLEIKLEELR
ncbi:NTP transferase domain-containing protein [Butyrivibrio fibrisolvens]|uniref:NTP transferase domain-containing protein n=1 Tax=Butyrivibrio fibrisolvens TaxID=831 RepID=UPI000424E89E|nr:NTP transferase domain-containing protein [Butyrivibrio fibrisolvens]